MKEKSDEHDSTYSGLPKEIVQKATSWYQDLPDLGSDKDPLKLWKDEAKYLPTSNYVPVLQVFLQTKFLAKLATYSS